MSNKKYNPDDYPEQTAKKKRIEKILCTPMAKNAGITTPRQLKLAAEMIAGVETKKPFKQMAIDAGYKVGPNSNVSHLKQMMSGKLGPALFEHGYTEFDLARDILEMRDAKKSIVSIYKDSDGKPKAKIVAEIPDNAIRMRARELLVKLGHYFKPPVRPQLPDDIPAGRESNAKSRSLKHFEDRDALIGEYEVLN